MRHQSHFICHDSEQNETRNQRHGWIPQSCHAPSVESWVIDGVIRFQSFFSEILVHKSAPGGAERSKSATYSKLVTDDGVVYWRKLEQGIGAYPVLASTLGHFQRYLLIADVDWGVLQQQHNGLILLSRFDFGRLRSHKGIRNPSSLGTRHDISVGAQVDDYARIKLCWFFGSILACLLNPWRCTSKLNAIVTSPSSGFVDWHNNVYTLAPIQPRPWTSSFLSIRKSSGCRILDEYCHQMCWMLLDHNCAEDPERNAVAENPALLLLACAVAFQNFQQVRTIDESSWIFSHRWLDSCDRSFLAASRPLPPHIFIFWKTCGFNYHLSRMRISAKNTCFLLVAFSPGAARVGLLVLSNKILSNPFDQWMDLFAFRGCFLKDEAWQRYSN